MARVRSSGGNIFLESEDDVVWSSVLQPVNLMSSAKLTKSLSISFPHIPGGNFYATGKSSGSGFDQSSCASFQTIYPGEWGPTRSGAFNLPDILLGTLPTGANMLDVTVNLTQTKQPSPYLGIDEPTFIQEGVPIALRGSSCQLEGFGPVRRMIDIMIIGTGIYLRRYQSILNSGDPDIWLSGNTDEGDLGGFKSGWTYGGNPNAQFAALIEAKGPGGNINKYRNGSNACSVVPTANFSSIWTGTAVIIPGRYNS